MAAPAPVAAPAPMAAPAPVPTTIQEQLAILFQNVLPRLKIPLDCEFSETCQRIFACGTDKDIEWTVERLLWFKVFPMFSDGFVQFALARRAPALDAALLRVARKQAILCALNVARYDLLTEEVLAGNAKDLLDRAAQIEAAEFWRSSALPPHQWLARVGKPIFTAEMLWAHRGRPNILHYILPSLPIKELALFLARFYETEDLSYTRSVLRRHWRAQRHREGLDKALYAHASGPAVHRIAEIESAKPFFNIWHD